MKTHSQRAREAKTHIPVIDLTQTSSDDEQMQVVETSPAQAAAQKQQQQHSSSLILAKAEKGSPPVPPPRRCREGQSKDSAHTEKTVRILNLDRLQRIRKDPFEYCDSADGERPAAGRLSLKGGNAARLQRLAEKRQLEALNRGPGAAVKGIKDHESEEPMSSCSHDGSQTRPNISVDAATSMLRHAQGANVAASYEQQEHYKANVKWSFSWSWEEEPPEAPDPDLLDENLRCRNVNDQRPELASTCCAREKDPVLTRDCGEMLCVQTCSMAGCAITPSCSESGFISDNQSCKSRPSITPRSKCLLPSALQGKESHSNETVGAKKDLLRDHADAYQETLISGRVKFASSPAALGAHEIKAGITTRPEQEQATKEECRDKDHRDSPSDLLLRSLMDTADAEASATEKWQFFEFRSRQDQIEPEATARYDDSDMIVDEERLPERFPSLAQWAKAIKGRAVSVKPCVFFKGKSLRKHEADLEAKKAVLQAATSRTRGQQPSRVEGGKKRKVYNISSQNPPDTASTRGQGAMQCQCQEVSASEIAAEVKAALASGLQQFHHRSDPEEDLQLHDRDMGRIGRMRDAKSAPRKFQKKMPKPGGYPLGYVVGVDALLLRPVMRLRPCNMTQHCIDLAWLLCYSFLRPLGGDWPSR